MSTLRTAYEAGARAERERIREVLAVAEDCAEDEAHFGESHRAAAILPGLTEALTLLDGERGEPIEQPMRADTERHFRARAITLLVLGRNLLVNPAWKDDFRDALESLELLVSGDRDNGAAESALCALWEQTRAAHGEKVAV